MISSSIQKIWWEITGLTLSNEMLPCVLGSKLCMEEMYGPTNIIVPSLYVCKICIDTRLAQWLRSLLLRYMPQFQFPYRSIICMAYIYLFRASVFVYIYYIRKHPPIYSWYVCIHTHNTRFIIRGQKIFQKIKFKT